MKHRLKNMRMYFSFNKKYAISFPHLCTDNLFGNIKNTGLLLLSLYINILLFISHLETDAVHIQRTRKRLTTFFLLVINFLICIYTILFVRTSILHF